MTHHISDPRPIDLEAANLVFPEATGEIHPAKLFVLSKAGLYRCRARLSFAKSIEVATREFNAYARRPSRPAFAWPAGSSSSFR